MFDGAIKRSLLRTSERSLSNATLTKINLLFCQVDDEETYSFLEISNRFYRVSSLAEVYAVVISLVKLNLNDYS